LGGFVITTKESCIKSVVGFSRFEFSLNPSQKVEFVVIEEAIYDSSISDLTNFISRVAPTLLKSEDPSMVPVLKQETVDILKSIVYHTEKKKVFFNKFVQKIFQRNQLLIQEFFQWINLKL